MFETLALNDSFAFTTTMGVFAAGGACWLSGVRIGPVRAVSLALKSKLFCGSGAVKSVRASNVEQLSRYLTTVLRDSCVVVMGDRGVGKTCMIDTTVRGMKGVVRVTIPAGTKETDVVSICQRAIIGGGGREIENQAPNVGRVLFWYHLLFRGQSPVIVITTSERPPGVEAAELTGAVPRLTRLGINIVVDGLPSSIHPYLLNSAHVVEVDALSREEVRALPQLNDLFATLDKERLSDVVLDLLGGVPSLYMSLVCRLKMAAESDDAVRVTVTKFLLGRLIAVSAEASSLVVDKPKFAEVLALLRDRPEISHKELMVRGLKLPSHCDILRSHGWTVQPSGPTVALYCQHDCDRSAAREAVLQRVRVARGE